jgi:hypothetical protein
VTQELTLARLRELAGIADQTETVIVLLPRKPAEEMKQRLAQLKEIWGIPQEQNLTAVDHDGETYIATGVERDL